jgi:lipid-binding SYLF domain-containing protein
MASSAAAAMDQFRADDPSLQQLLDRAVGWAIFPEVGKAGFVVGGSYGRGEVFERGARIGYADIKQGTFGLQIGAQTFSELVIFLREADLASFKKGEFSLAANISAVAIKPGVAGTTDTSKGVVVFVRTSGGLMAEAAVGGQVFSFEPL